jgi:serine/threonine protein kinase
MGCMRCIGARGALGTSQSNLLMLRPCAVFNDHKSSHLLVNKKGRVIIGNDAACGLASPNAPLISCRYDSAGSVGRCYALQVKLCDSGLAKYRSTHISHISCSAQCSTKVPSMLLLQVKICDFGLARHAATTMHSTYTPVTKAYTQEYTSPQRLSDFKRTFQDDVYAFGILMHFIATSDAPFHHIEKGGHPPSLLPSTDCSSPGGPIPPWHHRRFQVTPLLP